MERERKTRGMLGSETLGGVRERVGIRRDRWPLGVVGMVGGCVFLDRVIGCLGAHVYGKL